MTPTSPSDPETGVLRRVTIEATGGHRELQAIVRAVVDEVDALRSAAAKEQQETFNLGRLATRAFVPSPPINLEGTIKVETEDDL